MRKKIEALYEITDFMYEMLSVCAPLRFKMRRMLTFFRKMLKTFYLKKVYNLAEDTAMPDYRLWSFARYLAYGLFTKRIYVCWSVVILHLTACDVSFNMIHICGITYVCIYVYT